MHAFLDKDYEFLKCIHAVRLHYLRYGIKVRLIRTDAGSVEGGKGIREYLDINGIAFEPAAVDNQNQNPVERHVQFVDTSVAACMDEAVKDEYVDQTFWGLAVLSFIVAANYSPNTLTKDVSPWYRLTGKHPDLSNTCKFPFGQRVTVARTKQEKKKQYKFGTNNEVGIAVGSVTFNNGSTLVYLPKRTGYKSVFPRVNVQAISQPPREWLSEESDDEEKTTTIKAVPDGISEETQHEDTDKVEIRKIKSVMDMFEYRDPTKTHTELEEPPRYDLSTSEACEVQPPALIEDTTQQVIEVEKETEQPHNQKASKELTRNTKTGSSQPVNKNPIPDPVHELFCSGTRQSGRISTKPIQFIERISYVSFSINGTTITKTPTYKQAMQSEERDKWMAAIYAEFKTLEDLQTFVVVYFEDIPKGTMIIPTKWVLKVKYTSEGEYIKHKARLVATGNRDKLTLSDTFSPTATSKTVALVIALAVVVGLTLYGFDIYGAFLVPEIRRTVYVALPKASPNAKTTYWKLLRTLYGLADSPREFYEHLSKTLMKAGYTKSIADPCVFVKRRGDKVIICVIHVDDFIVAASGMDEIEALRIDLEKEYTVTESPTLESFLGLHLEHNKNGSVTISQPAHATSILQEHGLLECNHAHEGNVQ